MTKLFTTKTRDDSSTGTAPAAAAPVDGYSIYGTPQTLYIQNPGDPHTVAPGDIHEGTQVGDCFLLTTEMQIAQDDPWFIKQSTGQTIVDHGNGSQTVHLYVDAKTGAPVTFASTSFKSVYETVNDNFVYGTDNTRLSTDGVYNGQSEIWSQVIEKSVAQLGIGHTVTSIADYSTIAGGGYDDLAMETLTGEAATYESPAAATAAQLQTLLANHQMVTVDTSSMAGLPSGLISSHSESLVSVTGSGASAMVQLENPWGFSQPTAFSIASLTSQSNTFGGLSFNGITQINIGGHV